jgi:twitching motility protein PilT
VKYSKLRLKLAKTYVLFASEFIYCFEIKGLGNLLSFIIFFNYLLFKLTNMFQKLEDLAKNNKKISDFHIRTGSPLAYRQTGEIYMVKEAVVKEQDLKDLLSTNCNENEIKKFQETHELDSAVIIGGLRFRANFYKTLNGSAAVLRRVESKIPEMSSFSLPQVLYDIVDMHKGLVLVTGPTGSGKSTTLAAIVNEINKTRTANIITVEDPVEFIHKDVKSIVSHREVGKQTQTFATALKAALREDPDVILVGEMRDLETVSLALTAAETGHLVFGTLHTSGAPNTINRIIDVFPPEQQEQIRAQISSSLKMVVTQRLLKTKDGQGRVGAFEVMKCTPPVQNLIREAKIHQIPSVMQTSVRDGMITMQKSLEELVKAGKIDAKAGKES